jgi:hypothetical protein
MSSELRKFLIKVSLTALSLVIAGFIIFSFFLTTYYLPVYWLALAFFYILTIITHAWQLSMVKKSVAKFTRTSMVVTFLRLMTYSAFTVICLAVSAENAVAFVIVIITLYVVFTSLEVASLMKISRAATKNPE